MLCASLRRIAHIDGLAGCHRHLQRGDLLLERFNAQMLRFSAVLTLASSLFVLILPVAARDQLCTQKCGGLAVLMTRRIPQRISQCNSSTHCSIPRRYRTLHPVPMVALFCGPFDLRL